MRWIGYGGYAIHTALSPFTGEAGAAGITALLFLLVPIFAYLILAARARERARQASVMSLLSTGLTLLTTLLSKRR